MWHWRYRQRHDFSIELRDMGVGHDGDDVLYVYKNHQIADGRRITAIGVFESLGAALAIDIADPKQRDCLLQNTSVQLYDALKTQLKTALAAEARRKARKEGKGYRGEAKRCYRASAISNVVSEGGPTATKEDTPSHSHSNTRNYIRTK